MFAELRSKTNASFLIGASPPEAMVHAAHAQGYSALAITDIDEVGGVVRAHTAAKKLGLHLLIGTELTPLIPNEPPVVLIAKDRVGYGRLCRLLTPKRARVGKGQ